MLFQQNTVANRIESTVCKLNHSMMILPVVLANIHYSHLRLPAEHADGTHKPAKDNTIFIIQLYRPQPDGVPGISVQDSQWDVCSRRSRFVLGHSVVTMLVAILDVVWLNIVGRIVRVWLEEKHVSDVVAAAAVVVVAQGDGGEGRGGRGERMVAFWEKITFSYIL